MTVTERPAVAEAVETSDKVASHLHPPGSFDIDAHPVPTGREEIWRFTPLKRMRDLHKEAPLGPLGATTTVEVEAAEGVGVRTVGADDAARGSSGHVPADRISARAWAAAKDATVVTVPAESILERADDRALPRHLARRRIRRAPGGRGRAAQQSHRRLDVRGFGRARRHRRDRGRRRCAPHGRLGAGLGRRRRAPQHPARAGRPRRDAASRGRLLRRRPGAHEHLGRVRRTGRRGRAARAVLRRCRPAPRAPALRRPQRAEDPQQRRLQGRPARPGALTRCGSATC